LSIAHIVDISSSRRFNEGNASQLVLFLAADKRLNFIDLIKKKYHIYGEMERSVMMKFF